MQHLELRIPPVAVVLAFGLLAYLAAQLLPSLELTTSGSPLVVGALVAAGAVISLLGVLEFRRVRTTVNPNTPASATSLVTTGIYRVTRNPMYLGFALGLLGLAAWLSHPLAFLTVVLFVCYINRFQIAPEERALSAKFGKEFAAYVQAVRRWI